MFRLFVFLFFGKPLARRRIEAPQITSWNIRPSGHNIGLHLLSTSGACLSYPSWRLMFSCSWPPREERHEKEDAHRPCVPFLFLTLRSTTLMEKERKGRCTTCRYLFFGFLLSLQKTNNEKINGGMWAVGRPLAVCL